MSLVGSLEDLSLGDILQIISLSQKSGVLALATTGAAGRIVFVDGLVRGAAVKDGPQDLRGVLVGAAVLEDDEYSAAAEHAAARDVDVKAALDEIGIVSAERIEALCREAVESAVMAMFSWAKGDFSFDVRSEPLAGDPELLSPAGLNAQYLAMESARVGDEGGEGPTAADAVEAEIDTARFDEMSAHEMFGVSPEPELESEPEPESKPEPEPEFGTAPDQAAAVDALAMASIERADSELPRLSEKADALAAEILELAAAADETMLTAPTDDDDDREQEAGGSVDLEAITLPALERFEPAALFGFDTDEVDDELGVKAEPVGEGSLVEQPVSLEPPAAQASDSPARALVVIDRDLVALEWVKTALHADFDPIHIFQQTDPAMSRIRQYLVRGEPPAVLIAPGTPVDRLGGVADAVDFVSRLKAQSPRIAVLWLREDGSEPIARRGVVDGEVVRPDGNRLRSARSDEEETELAADFACRVRVNAAGDVGPAAEACTGPSISPDEVRRLRDATRALTDASSRGEALPLVIRFASEVFGRVAMFMVRDGAAVGMAQHGLEACGGPNDRDLRELAYPCTASSWIGAVLDEGKAVRGQPVDDGDRALVALLGDRMPSEAYLAPIESTGQVIALLYGDNLPGDGAVGDTTALEVVLHHAGLALDRAALERALREGDD